MIGMPARTRIIEGDITELAVDAIVNAANERMLGGGGVDGAIQRAAGPGLLEERRRVPEVAFGGRCPTGEARIPGGPHRPAPHVSPTAGPGCHGERRGEAGDLAACYRSSLALAAKHGLRTIARPAISTGVYAFPLDRATRIAVREVLAFLKAHPSIEQVTFCCFGDAARKAYERELAAQGADRV